MPRRPSSGSLAMRQCAPTERTQTLDESARDALRPILKSCRAKSEDLKKLFQVVIRKDDDKWYDRYKKVLGTLGKGDRVECLMEGILKDIQVLACERLTGTATNAQIKELEEAIKEMNEMHPSLPDEVGNVIQTHSGSGDNIGHTGPGTMNLHKGSGDLYHNVISGGATFGRNSINPIFNFSNNQSHQTDPQNRDCLKDLRTTDPREDKERIEQTKGGLLKNSYRWILKHPDFQQWRDDKQSRLLWIKGDPGKGKTMLFCGIVDEMSLLTRPTKKEATALLSYFFCQATDKRINNAMAVLRGLVYLLIVQQPSLISHVREKYDQGAENPFEGVNAWIALSQVFKNILQDLSLKSTYLIVDALDECETGLPQLLDLVVQSASKSPRVKWIMSSRNKPDIEAQLRLNDGQMRLSLEHNSEDVSHAVNEFIDFKVSQLPLIMDDGTLQETVRGQIYAKASGTFLWAALVLKELEHVESWYVLRVLQEMPPGLEPLYDRMMGQVQQLQREDPEFCRVVLSTMTLAYRPLHLLELGALSGLPGQISNNLNNITKVVNKCGSFLTVREERAYFIHQSAKDFLLKTFDKVFPSGMAEVNHAIFSRSL
ncbi:NACHT-domain-containing protein [Zopfia rhizophila CBS 207.26]|uniref:NACHT-domain-containing protein n=1 Tax=Zopfia rhizophila CBS 207.26 TaxID=1314779 RepID=A0A6A6EQZ8_9PEZI|nr:NACHT-domain-containing protein [Zopfia rhizophila CBS 207.26]